MAKKSTTADSSAPDESKVDGARQKSSALLDTRVIYCGDNLEQLKKLPDACVDLIYIDPPFKRQWIGIDISPTACRVMAKRMRDICGLPEKEPLWKIGRGFVVRDLPWTEEKLRVIPHFEFENWAVIALGGIPNKVQVGDMGVDGRIYPVSAIEGRRKAGADELSLEERWYPIQVK